RERDGRARPCRAREVPMMRCSLTISVLWILGAAVLVSAFDQSSTSTNSIDPVQPLEIVNRVDGFRRFYAKAGVSPLDADARYALLRGMDHRRSHAGLRCHTERAGACPGGRDGGGDRNRDGSVSKFALGLQRRRM